jgi:hypothetical protein
MKNFTDELLDLHKLKLKIYCPFSLSKQKCPLLPSCVKTRGVVVEWGIATKFDIFYEKEKLNHKDSYTPMNSYRLQTFRS